MKLVFKGKYSGDPESLPNRPHREGAVKFKEFDNFRKFAIALNIAALILGVALIVLYFFRAGTGVMSWGFGLGFLASVLLLIPHEILHAICVKETAYIYHKLDQGLLFVFAPESMSRRRFVFMSLLPNILFGFIPYALALIQPEWQFLAALGAAGIAAGAGDYFNIFNALTQVPRGGRVYMYGVNSYWYQPA